MFDDLGGFLGRAANWMGSGWTPQNTLGTLLGLGGGIASAFSRPTYQQFDTRTPQQMAGLAGLQGLQNAPPPQWTGQQMEQAARLAAMEGAGKAASRGFQVPGGGMIGLPQTISSEEALRQTLNMQGQNLNLQAGGRGQQLSAASQMASGPGFSYQLRPSVFNQALQAGRGFGSMVPQPMNQNWMGGNQGRATPQSWGYDPYNQNMALDELQRSQWPTQ